MRTRSSPFRSESGGVVLGETVGQGTYQFATIAGDVSVDVALVNNRMEAALTSVSPSHQFPDDGVIDDALAALGWRRDELDPAIPPAVGFAGARHLIFAVSNRDRLDRLDYDFDRLKRLMLAEDLTTLQLVWREDETSFHSRNPFPVGGVVEDPATGASAAALGGYLRNAGLIANPSTITIRQGEVMGRLSLLTVEIPTSGGITVRGTAVSID